MHPLPDTLLALGGWGLAVVVTVSATIYVWLLERENDELANAARAAERRAAFWRAAALGTQEAAAAAHKRTRELRWPS